MSRLLLILLAAVSISGRVYEKCDFAQRLLELEVPLEHIPRLVCVAERTTAFNSERHEGQAWGIFGLYNAVWCDEGGKPLTSACKVACEDLTKSMLSSVSCAMMVTRVQGYAAWGSSAESTGMACQAKNQTYLGECKSYTYSKNLIDAYCNA